MQTTATIARFLGWTSVATGVTLVAFGLFVSPVEQNRAEFDRCERARHLARRTEPCPHVLAPDRTVWLALGGSGLAASGVLILLLSGVLTTLAEIRAVQEADRRERHARAAQNAPTLISANSNVRARNIAPPERRPQRTEPMRQRLADEYGFALAARMVSEVQDAAARGVTLSETEAHQRAGARMNTHET